MSSQWTRRSFMEQIVIGAGVAAVSPRVLAASGPAIEPVTLGPSERLRLGIIGCGNRSIHHIQAANHYDRMEVAALCDIVPERMAEKKQLVQRGRPKLYKDYHQLVQQDELHAIAIVLPDALHAEATLAALDAGKHVLCEKPLTLTMADCRAVIEAADRNRRVLQVGTQSRHAAPYAELARRIHGGLVGNVLYAWINTFRVDWRKQYADPVVDSRLNWRMHQAQGGDVIFEQGIHTIDLFNWFINSEPEEITALAGVHNQKLQKRDSWDHAGVLVRYANGAVATYGGNLYSCARPMPDMLFGDGSTLEIGERTDATATLHTRTYWRPFEMGRDTLAGSEEISLPAAETNPSTLQYGHFLEAVQGLKPAFPSARDHMPAVQIAAGARFAMAEHRHVKASEVP